MANYMAGPELPGDHSFGGALVVGRDGTLLASWPLEKRGMLVVDIENGKVKKLNSAEL